MGVDATVRQGPDSDNPLYHLMLIEADPIRSIYPTNDPPLPPPLDARRTIGVIHHSK